MIIMDSLGWDDIDWNIAIKDWLNQTLQRIFFSEYQVHLSHIMSFPLLRLMELDWSSICLRLDQLSTWMWLD